MKRVALVTGTEATRAELVSQLEAVLQGVVAVDSYATDTGIGRRISADLVVLSTDLIREEALPWIDAGCPWLVARRTLNMNRLDELFAIPGGQSLLLVNDAPETAAESVSLIANLGLTHFTLIPYYPGCGLAEGPERAVTLGERELVPPFVSQIIDIGPRVIDLTTVVEILERLNLLDEKAALVSARYLETIVRLHRELYQSLSEKDRLNTYLTQVLDGVNDGILGFDRSGLITLFNQRCEEIFGMTQRQALGRRIQQLFGPEEVSFLQNGEAGADRAVALGQRQYILNRFTLEKRGSVFCTVRDGTERDRMALALRRDLLRKGHVAKYGFEDILGEAPALLEAVACARKLARADLSVLIEGETGTGKELFASAIHRASARAEGPFIAVNFSALPEELVESELFGYVEGAFTGARKGGRQGLFEQADGGTLFLDEIGDVSPRIQARLLRVLQEKEVMRVGGAEIIPVDVRIIAATHRSLPQLCREGQFREDLYFRLKRLLLRTPPLRSRRQDVRLLLAWFLQRNGKASLEMAPAVWDHFRSYGWPGNVRELESVAEYIAAVCEGPRAELADLPPDLVQGEGGSEEAPSEARSTLDLPDEEALLMGWIEACRARRRRVGRRSLTELARQQGMVMTESRVRGHLTALEQKGSIVIHPGRRGIELPGEGVPPAPDGAEEAERSDASKGYERD